VDPLPKRKLIEATSSDTVRTRMLSGKPARMLRSELTDAWEEPDCPGFLPMPLQGMLIHDARVRVMKFEVEPLEFYPTGQVVGMMSQERSVRDVMFEMISECVDTLERLHSLVEESDDGA
jgi:NAD(P)H-dependent flavin oxidoreductase YrpB (nitropropane dioxygenase family)